MKNKSGRFIVLSFLGGVFLYSVLTIIVRLRYTELGYQFEEAKSYERALEEEQVKLRSELSTRLSRSDLRSLKEFKDFKEPEPHQITVIP